MADHFLLLVLVVVGNFLGRDELVGILDEVGGQHGLAHFGEVRRVAAVVAADDEQQVHLLDAEHFRERVLPFLRRAADRVGLAEMAVERLAAVPVDHGPLEAVLHFLGLAFHHRGLVGHADGDQVLVGIEPGRVSALELLEEFLLVAALADVVADVIGFRQRENDEIMGAAVVADGLRNGRLGLLVPGLAVDDRGGALVTILPHALPDAHHVAAGRVDLVTADVLETVEHLHFRAERGDDDHVLLGQAVEVVDPARFLELLDAHVAELVVDFGVMDDFPEQVDIVALEDLGGGVGEVDRAFDAVAKAEDLRQLDRQPVGREVRLGMAQVFHHRAAVVAFHLFLHELHDLRGAKVHALLGCRRAGGRGQGVVGHPSSNRDRAVPVKCGVGREGLRLKSNDLGFHPFWGHANRETKYPSPTSDPQRTKISRKGKSSLA